MYKKLSASGGLHPIAMVPSPPLANPGSATDHWVFANASTNQDFGQPLFEMVKI